MTTIDERIAWVQWHINYIKAMAVRDDVTTEDVDFYVSELKMYHAIMDDLLAVRMWSIANNGTFEIMKMQPN